MIIAFFIWAAYLCDRLTKLSIINNKIQTLELKILHTLQDERSDNSSDKESRQNNMIGDITSKLIKRESSRQWLGQIHN
jgi:hypothetical protein